MTDPIVSPYIIATPEAAAAVPVGWVLDRIDRRYDPTVSHGQPARVGDRIRKVVLDVDGITQAILAAPAPSGLSWWPDVLNEPAPTFAEGDLVVERYDDRPIYGRVLGFATDGRVVLGTWHIDTTATPRSRVAAANELLAELLDGNDLPYNGSHTVVAAVLARWKYEQVPAPAVASEE